MTTGTTPARLVPMTPNDVASWRRARAEAGHGFPELDGADELEALEVFIGEVAVGGTVLTHLGGDRPRTTVRLLETSLADDDLPHWLDVLGALEERARARGSRTIRTAVAVGLVRAFQAAGFGATMTGLVATEHATGERRLEDTGHVRLRAATPAERATFAAEARVFLRDGMVRAGVLGDPDAPMAEVETRLDRLAGDLPSEDLLLVATVDDVAVGRFWGTVLPAGTGRPRTLLAHTLDLRPEHRGQGLTRHLLAAIETYARGNDLPVVRGRAYAHAVAARTTLASLGVDTEEVHLRKDLVASAPHPGRNG